MTKRKFTPAALAVAGLPLAPGWALAQQQSTPNWYDCGPGMMNWGAGGYGMFFGPFFMILVLALTIAGAALLVRWLAGPWPGTRPPHHMRSGPAPLDILRERYARGEIDKEEFEERRRALGE